MTTFLLAFGLLLLATLAMAIGAIVSGRTIAGSCGGLNAVPGADRCGACQRKIDPHSPDEARPKCPRARKLFTGVGGRDQAG